MSGCGFANHLPDLNASCEVGRSDRIAIHGRSSEGRLIAGSGDGLGQNPPLRLLQGNFFAWQPVAESQDAIKRLANRNHSAERRQVPDLPPCFSSSCIEVIVSPLSTAFIMS